MEENACLGEFKNLYYLAVTIEEKGYEGIQTSIAKDNSKYRSLKALMKSKYVCKK